MTDVIGNPPLNSALGVDKATGLARWSPPWANWLNRAGQLLFALSQSGTTAQRPAVGMLWIGRTYFDTTIGRPIWWNGTDWINAAGVVV